MIATDIFIVDDERVIGQTLAIILRQAGYCVEVFEDPHSALRALSHAPGLLLTDQNMPGLSGCSLASLFVLAHPGIAVLLFSGALSAVELEWQMLQRQTHASHLLHKPLHPAAMLRAVRDAIGDACSPQTAVPALPLYSQPFPRFLPPAIPLERVMQPDIAPAMMVV